MKIKICGIKNLDEINVVNKAKPDFIGFIFAKSKREVDFETAAILKSKLDKEIKAVGVFVDKPVDEILKYKKIIDFAQLHSETYTEEDIAHLKAAGLGVIKVIRVKNADFGADFSLPNKSSANPKANSAILNEYNINTKADLVLFDTFSTLAQGGLNLSFNWNIKIKSNVPYLVAGGINAENIEQMGKILHPWGADVSSGAEFEGIKTKEKVAGIIKIARGIKYE